MAKRVAIYARVSTDDKGQDPENQLRQLRINDAVQLLLSNKDARMSFVRLTVT